MIRIGFPLLIITGMVGKIIINFTELRVLLTELFKSGDTGMYSAIGFLIWIILSLVVTAFVYRQSNKSKMALTIWLLAFLIPPLSLYPIGLAAEWVGKWGKVDSHLIFAFFLILIILTLMWVIIRRNYTRSKFYFYRKRKSISVVMLLPYLWLYISIFLIQLGVLAVDINPRQIFYCAVAALVVLGIFAFGTDLRQI